MQSEPLTTQNIKIMKYTEDTLWEAIYVLIPSFKTARDAGAYLTLPACLNSAIIAWAVLRFQCDKNNASPNQLHVNASEVLLHAFLDLDNHDKFIFERE